MILKYIFQGAALTTVHTGLAAGVAAAMGDETPLATGFTSFAVGIPALLGGAFIGDAYSPDKNNEEARQRHANICGLLGYAAGSAFGFVLKHS